MSAKRTLGRLGKAIRRLRRSRRMSLCRLAIASHVSKSNLSKIENHGLNLTVFTLCRIAHALGLKPHRLLELAA